MGWLKNIGKAIGDAGEWVGDRTGIGSLLEGIGGLGLGDITGANAIDEANKKQQEQYDQYLQALESSHLAENIYTPQQLEAQNKLYPIQQQLFAQALGIAHPPGVYSPEVTAMGRASARQNELARSREQEQIRGSTQRAVQGLMEKNRQLMGGGSSGHIAGNISDIYQNQIPLMAQAEAGFTDRQRNQAQNLMEMITSTAFGKPMGNLPYNQGMAPAPTANMANAQFIQQMIGSGISMLPLLL